MRLRCSSRPTSRPLRRSPMISGWWPGSSCRSCNTNCPWPSGEGTGHLVVIKIQECWALQEHKAAHCMPPFPVTEHSPPRPPVFLSSGPFIFTLLSFTSLHGYWLLSRQIRIITSSVIRVPEPHLIQGGGRKNKTWHLAEARSGHATRGVISAAAISFMGSY